MLFLSFCLIFFFCTLCTCRSEEEGRDAEGEEAEVEELLSKSLSTEVGDSLGKSVTCSTLLSKSKSREGGELEDCSTLPTAPTESSLHNHTRFYHLIAMLWQNGDRPLVNSFAQVCSDLFC